MRWEALGWGGTLPQRLKMDPVGKSYAILLSRRMRRASLLGVATRILFSSSQACIMLKNNMSIQDL